jgi:hypothetical protein
LASGTALSRRRYVVEARLEKHVDFNDISPSLPGFGSIVGSYYYRVYDRGAIRERGRAEFSLQQVIPHLLIEVTVICLVHSQETGDSIGSDLEYRDEVKGARVFGGVDGVGGDELCGRLDFRGTIAASAWALAVPNAGTGSSAYATTCAGARTWSPCAGGRSGVRGVGVRRGSRWRGRGRLRGRHLGRHAWWRDRGWYRRWRLWFCGRRRGRRGVHVVQGLGCAAPAASAAAGAEETGRARIDDQEGGDRRDEQQRENPNVYRNRRDEAAPSSLIALRNAYRRPIGSSAAGWSVIAHGMKANRYFVSLGGTPMTLTPPPRAISIAVMMS